MAALLLAGSGLLCYTAGAQKPSATPSPVLHGDAAHPAKTHAWLDTKLYFGLGPADDATKGVSEARVSG